MKTKLVVWQKREGRDEEVKKKFWTLKAKDDELWLMEIPEKSSVKVLGIVSSLILLTSLVCLALGSWYHNIFFQYYLSLGFLTVYFLFYFVVVKDKGRLLVKRPNDFRKGDVVIPEMAGNNLIGVRK